MNATPLSAALAVAMVALVAALSITPGIAHADGAPKILKKVPPEFPGEATRKGITDGVLKAKLSIDASGAVTEVAIVEATPPKAKIFNDAATTALNQWKFEASGKPQTFELKLVFSME
ncbi:TonB family protein [Ideonella sp.]|uniref:TonB family protein n=1 Tax=Ideonella sp. TaxID=1929293 RepID=UPI002B470E94|nr:TonB family protein [Ideonella sp.]HJV69474.1 TonB family protein [Ideonella sp.]